MNKYVLLAVFFASTVHAEGEMRATLQSAESAICRDNANKAQCVVAVQKLIYAVNKVTELNENCKKSSGDFGIQQQCKQSDEAIGYINSLGNKQ
ncbi:hypothetical protein SNN84_003442 [Cronobacter sakazakii]|uniref:Uncharacterized protein n=1 Tax=Cronobacter sakazakii TaxID=28141 RepID=A0AAN5X6N7_CROSK|nr:hypothetical protein [Cronobacter sakazakii]EGT4275793.1 hypothetical protein [Cronobacter sakazakii]EGT5694813.1 hypothetical protein [Cronobacter sakazakii]EGT5719892.1 hypothetical protein [Cronobacter sakazakii]EGT5723007.1 hypothetical protein [Cronobacter sakazakii]EJG0682448.1 hypothetical protein [Cronobacter sakazakii]